MEQEVDHHDRGRVKQAYRFEKIEVRLGVIEDQRAEIGGEDPCVRSRREDLRQDVFRPTGEEGKQDGTEPRASKE